MPTRVKICGITRTEDAIEAVAAGADALGFMFFEGSKRFVTPEVAAAICRQLPPFVAKVGVFVDAPPETMRHVAHTCGLDAVQLHGAENPALCASLAPLTVIKAFRVADEDSLAPLPDFPVAAWLLDSYVPGELGGTGARFNWQLAVRARAWGRPIILAGGLTPENVAEAVRQVKPYAVDVSSGVESAPGKKDASRLRAFIAAAKGAG
ncbi:MAG: phosphoribosylanthranilate isomerase [Verrucomicrobia bacterium]|nr:phosphoribosylanthranilate isomerase [Verrucomicrobiota bacterium]